MRKEDIKKPNPDALDEVTESFEKLRKNLEEGLQQVKEGNTYTTEEIKERLRRRREADKR